MVLLAAWGRSIVTSSDIVDPGGWAAGAIAWEPWLIDLLSLPNAHHLLPLIRWRRTDRTCTGCYHLDCLFCCELHEDVLSERHLVYLAQKKPPGRMLPDSQCAVVADRGNHAWKAHCEGLMYGHAWMLAKTRIDGAPLPKLVLHLIMKFDGVLLA